MPDGRSRRPLMYLALAIVVVSGLAAAAQLPVNRPLFGGFVLVDTYSTFFKLMFLIATGLVLLASELYADRLRRWEGWSYAGRLFGTVGLMVLGWAGEFITLFLALELSSLAQAFLVCWSKTSLKATEAALKYFVLSVLSSAVLLYGVALLYGLTGQTSLAGIGVLL